jgi:hypothetical protein
MPRRTLTLIPPELQARVAALDARCDVTLHRVTEYRSTGAGGVVCWSMIPPQSPVTTPGSVRRACRVRIELRRDAGGTGATSQIIDAADRVCAAALEAAVTEAERRGWHQPL